MAVSIFLNFEKLSLEIAENEIAQMTDDNQLEEFEDIGAVDDDKFKHNLYHGSIAAVFIANIYEATLNTILSSILGIADVEILKTSHSVKLQLICAMYQVDINSIKGDNSYSCLKKIQQLRNDLSHFKCNEVSVGHFIHQESKIPMGTSKDSLAKMFTKTYMQACYDGVIALLELICQKCGLVLYKECQIIDSDGRDGACEFVVTQQTYDERDRD
ncbi:MAG: hypothetical protein IKU58_00455 [Clostridia bacterium]|nr:hypothetical protein [Clostridia bacterium]